MNVWFAIGAALAFLAGLSHSWLGERYIISRLLRRSDLPRLRGDDTFTKHTIRFAWHLTTVAGWGLAGTLLVIAPAGSAPSDRNVASVVAATFLVSSLLALVGSRGRHFSWLVLLAIAIAVWLGLPS